MYYRFHLSIKDGKRATIRETGPNDGLAIAWAIGMVFFPFPTLFSGFIWPFPFIHFFLLFCLLAYTWAHFFTFQKK